MYAGHHRSLWSIMAATYDTSFVNKCAKAAVRSVASAQPPRAPGRGRPGCASAQPGDIEPGHPIGLRRPEDQIAHALFQMTETLTHLPRITRIPSE